MGLFRSRRPPPPMRAALAATSFPANWPGDVPTRETAWSVPAVAAGLQTFLAIADFPLVVVDDETGERYDTTAASASFPRQIDPYEPREATLTKLIIELLLFPRCYLRVLRRDHMGRPDQLQVYPFETVTEPADTSARTGGYTRHLSTPIIGTYDMAGEQVSALDVFVIESWWDGLLVVGRDAITQAADWEGAASRAANEPVPTGVIRNGGADLPPDKVKELLDQWETARRTRSTAFLSSVLEYEALGADPESLGMNDARNFSVAEIARLLNLPPSSSSINSPVSSSLTYKNTESQRRDLVDVAYRPVISAIEGWLSRLVPRGKSVRMNVDQFLRADVKTLAEVGAVLKRGGIATVEEIRTMLGLPDEPDGELSEPQQIQTPSEVTDETEQEMSQP